MSHAHAAVLPPHGSFALRLLKLLFREPRPLRQLTVAALLEGLLLMAPAWLSSHAIDTALPEHSDKTLALLALLAVAAGTHAAFAGFVHERVTLGVQSRLEGLALAELMPRLLVSHSLSRSPRDFGDATQTMSAAGTATMAIVQTLGSATVHALSALVLFVALAWASPSIALATLLVAAATAAVAALAASREIAAGRALLDASGKQRQLLHLLLRSLPTLRVSGATPGAFRNWAGALDAQALAATQKEEAQVSRTVTFLTGSRLLGLAVTIVMVQGTLAGTQTVGQLMFITLLVTAVMETNVELMKAFFSLITVRPELESVDGLLRETDELPTRGRRSVSQPELGDCIELEGVWFRYDECSPWVLEEHSARFSRGCISLIRAPSGSGKSTVLRLISGLLRPERGKISVLGNDPASCRGLVAYLPQQATLMEGSILANLCLLSGSSPKELQGVAELTGLSELLKTLPMGVQTTLSTGGGNLSAGQRQLILLTAVFAMQSPVVLLDEPSSQLDVATAARINWSELGRDRTVVIVAHG